MQVFGLSITRRKAAVTPTQVYPSNWSGGWWPVVREAFTGAWQRNIEIKMPDVLTHGTVWACATLIASDISKCYFGLVKEDRNGITEPAESPAFSPVLRKPNHYQNRIVFFYCWLLSKLLRGNTYILKVRDNRQIVTDLYVLDPSRVTPLVAPNGEVFYQLGDDNLSGLEQADVVPASEIIHDIMVPLYHPLVGVSPIHACGLAAIQGLKIQNNSAKLFANGSQLSGVLTAPGVISNETAERLQKHWEANYAGEQNIGKVAVLGDGLKFEPMTMTAVDAQLIDQLKWSDERVCSCFHVPPYMVGVGSMPAYTNIEALNQQYYSQCLQALIEAIELCLDEGLGAVDAGYEIECDLDGLLRMDSATKMEMATKGVRGGIFTPNDGRERFNKKPLKGGDTVYMQHQDYSIAALAARDAQGPAPGGAPTAPPAAPPAPVPAVQREIDVTDLAFDLLAREVEVQFADLLAA